MPKTGEVSYAKSIGPEGRQHAFEKPFSDPNCGKYLIDIGTILSLLPPPPASLIDFGCGAGWTSVMYARRGYHVVGQDIAPDMIALAEENRRRAGCENVRFVISDFESLDVDEPFDCGVFYDCLHHAEDEGSALKSAWRVLKPGGVLITHEPGEGHSKSPEAIEAVNRFRVTERDMPPHLIARRAREAGFRSVQILPQPSLLHKVAYDPPSRLGRRLGPLFRLRLFRALGTAAVFFYKPSRVGGLVVLTK